MNSILVYLSLIFTISSSNAFTLKLIHRDSPHSPLYQPNLSHLQSLMRDIKTSKTRVSNLKSLTSLGTKHPTILQYSLFFTAPVFTLDARIGTPGTKTTLVFDTTAPLTWTQCKPCMNCFKQKQPVFDPTKSSSFKRMYQNHTLANLFNCTVLECYYFVNTRVGQSSSGLVSTETFHFPGPLAGFTTDVVFGCGTYNLPGPLGSQTALTGVLGMRNFPTSLARQMENRAGARFSYCLSGSRNKSSVLSFGGKAVISGGNVQTAMFLRGPRAGNSLRGGDYRLKLIGISVAGKRLEIPIRSFDSGCIIDTGAPFSILEEQAYRAVLDAISGYFGRFKCVKKIVNKKYPKNLCYKYPRGFCYFPGIVWHFEGANLEVSGTSLFLFGRNLFMSRFACLQLLGGPETNVLGVYQQQNVRFLYDLGNEKLSFVFTLKRN